MFLGVFIFCFASCIAQAARFLVNSLACKSYKTPSTETLE
ncbi:hypothetical protein C427_3408 [Paraglaciecola psychrophila 170]|uniref:Uncharacterized protein n=1 Tax=Paraglaciecola psychrophila 170 TaxID=1129794 RepID=K7ASD4_9ALTE|nr:hypothetical protein C427_3408 [Paraglaciecola psychrophila 170]GAC38180.1 hypothetical protein GPSY_2566 [Paraglaciecola psychrophila 170]